MNRACIDGTDFGVVRCVCILDYIIQYFFAIRQRKTNLEKIYNLVIILYASQKANNVRSCGEIACKPSSVFDENFAIAAETADETGCAVWARSV